MKRFFLIFLSMIMLLGFSGSAAYATESNSKKTVNVYLDETVDIVSFIKDVEKLDGEVLTIRVNRFYYNLPVKPRLPIIEKQSVSKSIGVSSTGEGVGYSMGVSYSISDTDGVSYSTSYGVSHGVSMGTSVTEGNSAGVSQGVSQGVSVSKSASEAEALIAGHPQIVLISKVKISENKLGDLLDIKGVRGVFK